jgi:uncharacterized Ntn-hydrolase superfamily protein
MIKKLLISVSFCLSFSLQAQDTFSIVAADSTSRKVGSAGASCVNLQSFGITDAGFLGDLLPNKGAINTQSFYSEVNQNNARERMLAGDSPQEIISWLTANDATGNPGQRQYGISGFVGENATAAAFTGNNCYDYKNHITGNINGIAYAIQGNILLNQEVLDSMEYKFRNTDGSLECRLMAALQGANVIGADTRCAQYNTSSLFAFLKVAEPNDQYGFPSFNISVISSASNPFEPIDSLQRIFNSEMNCSPLSIKKDKQLHQLKIYPNPTTDRLIISAGYSEDYKIYITDIWGRLVFSKEVQEQNIVINTSELEQGIYFIKINDNPVQRFFKIN